MHTERGDPTKKESSTGPKRSKKLQNQRLGKDQEERQGRRAMPARGRLTRILDRTKENGQGAGGRPARKVKEVVREDSERRELRERGERDKKLGALGCKRRTATEKVGCIFNPRVAQATDKGRGRERRRDITT